MTPRSQRLQPLQQIASMREDEALRVLAGSQKHAADHSQRLEELQRYIEDYSNAMPAQATPALLGNRHAFLARLREAEAHQRNAVTQAQANSELERARYLLKRRDSGTLEQLAASYRTQERVHDERRAQKELDEIALRRAFSKT